MKKWLSRVYDNFYRLFHWEYWSPWAIYLPLTPIWLYHSFRVGRLFFFEKANPGLPFGGMAMTPKSLIYDKLPKDCIPSTLLVNPEDNVLNSRRTSGLSFPLIVKPNHGLKGLGVEVINDEQGLVRYRQKYNLPFLIQALIPYSNEVGIFYCRIPGAKKGTITGVVKKQFLHVVGDGRSTLSGLIDAGYRTRSQREKIKGLWQERWNEIIEKEKTLTLLPVGSHTRGATFTDYSSVLTPALLSKIDEIACQIEGFYYGRFDILYADETQLQQGEGFKIIELNGAMSEPTHMYDPSNSLWTAWKEIARHWRLMADIAIANRNVPCKKTGLAEGFKLMRQNWKLEKGLKRH